MDLPCHSVPPPPAAARDPSPGSPAVSPPDQNARHPAASTRISSRRARGPSPPHPPGPPPPSLRAHPRRPFPATQAARRKTTLRRATSRAGDARRRALLCVGAFLLLVPAGARPGYRCGQHANRCAFAALDEQGAIHAWGASGSGAPSGTGFTAIFSTGSRSRRSTTRAPSTRGASLGGGRRDHGLYRHLFDVGGVRDARRPGPHPRGGDRQRRRSGAPSGTGFTAIFSTSTAFAALDEQGAIHAWGAVWAAAAAAARASRRSSRRRPRRSRRSTSRAPSTRGARQRRGAPSGTGFTAIASTD